ncbi:MAG: protein-L-isoaspartate(D-aspartate) O-methyltransferase [Desulfotomaculum sp.]|nr:protein-L-isoaspartate(D-aspartate) O-methyltransferase [Desulfotomaculum sp.]
MQRQDIYNFFKELDRSYFIDNEYKKYAHQDRPLPIGYKQTISQPSLVMEMTLLLDVNRDCKVLEVGTGSGYQTAILAEFAGEVYTIERIEELSLKAQKRLLEMGYNNIHYKIGDGSEGWLEHAPYDRIIVTAGAGELPQDLVEQLKPKGKMVVPVGKGNIQELLLVAKNEKGYIITENFGNVRFVELKGKYGWNH